MKRAPKPKPKNPHAAALGALGGRSTSAKKIAAVSKNLDKARAKRWVKRP
jgi:hypothetical protein